MGSHYTKPRTLHQAQKYGIHYRGIIKAVTNNDLSFLSLFLVGRELPKRMKLSALDSLGHITIPQSHNHN